MRRLVLGFMVAGVVSVCLGSSVAQVAERVTNNREVAETVALENLVINGGDVSGTLVNHSRYGLRNIKVLVRHAWLWRDEKRPGFDNPARAVYYVYPNDLPAGQTASFSYTPSPPLPARADGRFKTTAEIVSFEEVGF